MENEPINLVQKIGYPEFPLNLIEVKRVSSI